MGGPLANRRGHIESHGGRVVAAVVLTGKPHPFKYIVVSRIIATTLMIPVLVVIGDATGRTILSTIKILRNKEPRKIVVAVPVASEEAADRIKEVVDDFICLHTPYPFYGVGRFYADFTQVEDEDVLLLLNELNTRGKVA